MYSSKGPPLEPGRLIIDEASVGSRNMAVDQAILEATDASRQLTLRVYQWEPATLSLGYFQNHDDRSGHVESHPCPWVRRSSGGGAILHHHEITYSLCVPDTMNWFRQNVALYDLVHRATIETLSSWKVNAELFDEAIHPAAKDPKSFLCFQRRTPGDIVCDGYKIGGSAQRRSRKSLLQHGSFLLRQSEFSPQLPGVRELSGAEIQITDFIENWCENIKNRMNLAFVSGHLSQVEEANAERIEKTRFEDDHWNKKR